MPFQRGGAELLCKWLVENLRLRGHAVEVLEFPFSPHPEEILDQLLAFRLMDLSRYGDRLIAVRPPSYLVRHPQKVVWFIHHHRSAYDLWGTEYSDLPPTPEALRYRDAIRQADGVALREARRVFANSQVVAARLESFNGIRAEVLYPPLMHPERYTGGDFGDYLLYVSRLTPHKRQWLAIEALRHTRTPVRLVIAGKADPGAESYVWDLKARIANGLKDRVVFVDRYIDDAEKIALLAECLGALYIAYEEDSYGFFSLEAQQAGKPVLSTTDAGGTRELIRDGVNGRLVAPDPQALAEAMDELYANRDLARQMGEAGRQQVAGLDLCWERVVAKLLS